MKQLAALALCTMALPALAVPLAQWNFNSDDGLVNTGSLSPVTGAGSLALVGGATAFFTSGSPNDPATFPLDSSWSVGGYPAQGSNSGTVGFAGFVSTLGHANVTISFDFKTQPSGNKWFELQASANGGGAWTDIATFEVPTADQWFTRSFDVSSALSAANNNPDFAFRVVSIFKPGTSLYEASEAGYNGDFGLQYDQLSVQATAVPEPSSTLLMMGGLLACYTLAKRRP